MKKLLSVIIFSLGLASCKSGKKMISLDCNGGIKEVGLSVEGQAPCTHCVLEKEVFKKGISLVLEDTLYKISRFTVTYTNGDRVLIQKKVRGSLLRSKNASFLKELKEGDVISIDCIEIVKGRESFLSTTMLIRIR